MKLQVRKNILILLLVLTPGHSVFAGDQRTLSLDGTLSDSSGNPISGVVSFDVQITDGAGCVLWEETQSVTAAVGAFGFQAGIGTVVFDGGGTGKIDRVFAPNVSLNCKAATPTGAITAATTANRQMLVQFNTGSGWQSLPSPLSVSAMPFAMVAENTAGIGGFPVSSTTPTTNQVLQWQGGTWVPVTLATAAGTVTSVTSSSTDLSVSNSTTTPTLTLNSGVLAGQILKLNAAAQIPAVDGSLLTLLNPTALSAAVPVGKGGTGVVTAPTNGQLLIGNAGSYSVASLTAGTGISVTPGAGTLTLATTGAPPTGAGGGDLTGTYPNPTVAKVDGISYPAAASAPVNTVPVVTSANASVTYETVPVAAGGTAATTFGPNRIVIANGTGTSLTNDACSANQVLQMNSIGTAWSCVAGSSLGTPTSLSGLTAATSAATLSNLNNLLVWNWTLTANGTALTIGEAVASTGATTGSQNLFQVRTIAGSTANPLSVVAGGVAALTVGAGGAINGKASTASASTTIDFSSGNLQYSTASCGAFILNNMKDGSTYTFAVKGTVSATCSFAAYSDAGVTLLTVHLPPDHGATVSGYQTLYTFVVLGTDVYAAWVTGY